MSSKQKQRPIVTGAVSFVVGVLAIVLILPVAWGFVTSIKSSSTIFSKDSLFWGFSPTYANYDAVLSGSFPKAFFASIAYSLGVTFVGLIVATLAAYALDRLQFPLRRLTFTVVISCVPLSIGATVLVVPNYLYLSALHFTNHWYTLPLWYLGLNLPLAIWVLKGSIENVPTALDDAAKIDGVGHGGIIARIIIPLVKPGLFASSLLIFIGSWNEFVAGSVFVQESSLRPVQVAVYQYISAYGRQWGPLTSSALLAIIPIVIFILFSGKYLVAGLTQGAAKG